ncbi:MAG: hydantoinase B/oxoprolinase family protein, partial [Sphingomonadales bacterium]|nr:hydantoinase B/oxoprolinase family protein [Sphingomonadales bacterium]
LRRYVDRVSSEVGDIPLYFMQSNGGLARAEHFEGKDAILSGPAGGIVGAVAAAKAQGISHIIGFDMGGTSTDVSHFNGHFERADETTVAGVRLKVPMLDIHTVAAGGGSICTMASFDGKSGGRARVGPESAGANPGPAAYGRGGPITVTDCNLMTGRIQPDFFPHVFGPESDQPLDVNATQTAFQNMVKDHAPDKSAEELAEGFLYVAVEHMARAIKKISVERGHNLTRYALMSFGGAGGQFACRVADALHIEQVLIHPLSGVLSAYGIGLADLRHISEQTVELPLEASAMDEVQSTINALQTEASTALKDQGISAPHVLLEVAVKYKGSDSSIRVPMGKIGAVKASFLDAHQRQFGFIEPEKDMIIELASAEAYGGGGATVNIETDEGATSAAIATRKIFSQGQWQDAPLYDRDHMREGQAIHGPAIIVEGLGTNVVEAGWSVVRTAQNNLLFSRTEKAAKQNIGTECDPILLEVFNNRFMNIAEEMGAILEKTAHSVNMKERLDFSCALFDRDGNLVANAPHMPVHLGSMSDSVLTIARRNATTMKAGDVYMLNDPYHGGTHLPDVTVVAPVMMEGEDAPSYFVASRGHHADIGGISPGSMPAFSTTIDEEGVVFDNVLIQRDGVFLRQAVIDKLTNAPLPARNPTQNVADLKAQMASCARAVELIEAMTAEFGKSVVDAYMGFVQDNAEAAVKAVIPTLKASSIRFDMDGGTHIDIAITPDGDQVTVDFTGTSDQLNSNFNAPRSITTAATLYVFRTLVGDDIPLNAGCLRPIKLIVPTSSFLNP